MLAMILLLVISSITLHALQMYEKEKLFMKMETEYVQMEQLLSIGLEAAIETAKEEEEDTYTLAYSEGTVDVEVNGSGEDYEIALYGQYKEAETMRRYDFIRDDQTVQRTR